MDPDEPRRRGGPRRTPANRRARRQPAPRRTSPGRLGTPRRKDPPSRPQRPVPPPRPPHEDAPAHHEPPAYGEAPPPPNGPAHGQGPAFGAGPPYREAPAHGQVPAPRNGPAYGAAPAYGQAPGYGQAPAYGEPPGYDDRDGHDDGGGYQDAAPYGDEGGYPGDAGHGPADHGGYDEPAGTAEKRGTKGKQRGKAGQGRPGRPPGRKRPAAAQRGQGAKLYFGAAAGLLVIVLAGLGAVVGLRGESGAKTEAAAGPRIGTPAETGLSPKSYSSSASAPAYSGIASRRADPGPLTIGEVFPSSAAELSVPDGEVQVKLRAKRLDGDCAAAVWGATVGQVLGEGGCTQAARGIYSGGDDGYALAVAVFNLAGSKEADRFVATLEDTIGSGFVRPLEAPAPLDGFGRGFGMARGLAMGHFAVVAWAQRMDGEGGPEDESMLSLLIEGGQNPAVLGRAARTSD